LQQQQSRKGNNDDQQQHVWKGEGKRNFKVVRRARRSGGIIWKPWVQYSEGFSGFLQCFHVNDRIMPQSRPCDTLFSSPLTIILKLEAI
jgi:hypothetical protein